MNAFLKPGKASLDAACEAIKTHHANLKRVWGIQTAEEVELTEDGETTLDQFVSRLVAHVA